MSEKDKESGEQAPPTASGASLSTFPRRNRELFTYLLTTFRAMLPPDKAAQFAIIAEELQRAIEENCTTCAHCHIHAAVDMPRDPRRSRFLLRLVVGKVSHLFSGDVVLMPRSLIEGLDRYLKKAFGDVIYSELNTEADQLLYNLNLDDDKEMWERIRANSQWRRLVDTVFIRILFRFENFTAGKKTFVAILSSTMQEVSRFDFTDDHFYMIFEALFSELWIELENEEQRIRYDFLFGDGSSKRLTTILTPGLARWLKRKDAKVLGSGRVVPAAAAATAAPTTKKLPPPVKPSVPVKPTAPVKR